MAKIEQIVQTSTFRRAVKKLKPNQKTDLDRAIKALMENPLLGDRKRGDLSYLRVYKFKMVKQLTLLGYQHIEGTVVLELLNVDSHENFYRDLKR